MGKNTIAGYLAGTLAAAGIERIWDVTGDSFNGLAYSLAQARTIRWMHTRHEKATAFAAGADAAPTDRIAVCAGGCGPGDLHLIYRLFDCHRNHQPVLAIATQPILSHETVLRGRKIMPRAKHISSNIGPRRADL